MGDHHKTREFLEQHPKLIPEIESFTPEAEPELISAPVELVDKVPKQAKRVDGDHSSTTTTGAVTPAPTDTPTASEEDGEALVADLERFITRFVILPGQTALPLAPWVLATFCHDAFDSFGYLLVVSPAPRCGKTRLLETLSLIVSEPRRIASTSEPALFRTIAEYSPTLLLDEMETLNSRSERAEYLKSLLNAGNRCDAVVTRCEGKDFKVKEFNVFCPKILAGIGRFPHTIRDRSIILPMQRRKTDEKVARFIFREVRPVGEMLRQRAQAFIERQREQIERAYLELDLKFLEDRDCEIWEPLFAVMTVADPSRLAELRTCAERLCRQKASADADESLAVKLLSDLRDVWPTNKPHAYTRELLGLLRDLGESPWSTEIDLNPHKMARFLKGFDVRSRKVRVGDATGKGYILEELEAAFARYLAPNSLEGEHGEQPA